MECEEINHVHVIIIIIIMFTNQLICNHLHSCTGVFMLNSTSRVVDYQIKVSIIATYSIFSSGK